MHVQGDINTPGIYYALAYFLSSSLIIRNSPKRLRTKRAVLVQLLFLLLLSVIMVASDGTVMFFIPLMFLYLCMIVLDIYVNCTYAIGTAVYFGIRAFIIGEFTASFEWQVAYYAMNADCKDSG